MDHQEFDRLFNKRVWQDRQIRRDVAIMLSVLVILIGLLLLSLQAPSEPPARRPAPSADRDP